MPVKVSVVVPVYNPGEHIRPLIDSLLRQSLDAAEFEAVFVDDGSTDATPALLDRLADEHPHFHVIHQPNSGWPGKPRNVGIEHAQGDYVFFSDNDDWFGDEALERLYDAAVAYDADIVIGKMVGHDRGVPRELFRRNRENATFDNAPLQDSLTPHKLFRRSFLDEHSIRFPEGKRRLEDHVFVMQSYFAAKSIYVLSDYDCYHHIGRPDESNAGYTDIDPVSYYGYVRETVDIVLANTGPGVVQDRCLRRFLRVEVLTRLEGARFTATPEDYQKTLFDAARRLVVETMPRTVDAGLPGRQRLVAQLLRAGDRQAVHDLADWTVRVRSQITAAEWDHDVVRVQWSAALGPGALVTRDGGRYLLQRGDARLDVTDDLGKTKFDLIGVDPDRGEVILPTTHELTVRPDGHLTAVGSATIRVGGGASELAAGVWTLRLRARTLGWVADSAPLRGVRSWRGLASALVGGTATLVRPARTRRGAACVDVGGRAKWLDADTAIATRARPADDGLALSLPVLVRDAPTIEVRVGKDVVTATLRQVSDAPPRAEAQVTVPDKQGSGRAIAVRAAAGNGRWIDVGIDVTGGGDKVRAGRPPRSTASLLARRAKRQAALRAGTVARTGSLGRGRVRRVARRVLRPVR